MFKQAGRTKYILIANGTTLLDSYGLEVEIKDKFVSGIAKKEEVSLVRENRSYWRDKHCVFTSDLSKAHAELEMSGIIDYRSRCEKLYKNLTFEIYELDVKYEASKYIPESELDEEAAF